MADKAATSVVLDELAAVIAERRGADPDASYTAAVLAGGVEKAARKLGEEALETVIAALSGSRGELTAESADLLYHLMILWAAAGVEPSEVWAELARRRGVSGHAEKAARGDR